MQINKDTVVAFHYKLYEVDQMLEDSGAAEPVLYMHGKQGMLQGLQDELEGKRAGDEVDITLPPEKAYGHRQDVQPERVPIKHVRSNGKIKTGDVVQVNTQEGPREVLVIKVGRFNVDVDTNHPLAGKTLRFVVTIHDVREATTEELAHGHAHGAGGHQH